MYDSNPVIKLFKCYPNRIFTMDDIENAFRQLQFTMMLLRLHIPYQGCPEDYKIGDIINISKLLGKDIEGIEEFFFYSITDSDSTITKKIRAYKDDDGLIYGLILG